MSITDIIETGRQCLHDEAEAILAALEHIDDNFARAVDLILGGKGKCIVTGVGKSGHIGRKIAATLASTGTPAFFLNPLDAYHGDLGMVSSDDVVVAISYSGNTDELLRIIPTLVERKVTIIGITGDQHSLLAQNSAVCLNVHVDREADYLNLAPTTSTTVTLVVGDALACALEQRRHFRSEDFARFHPGGYLGRKLQARVEEVMFTDHLPLLSPSTPMAEAITIVTDGNLGVGVVTENDALVGIITDGDIRRAMQRFGQAFFNTPVSQIMSRNPKTISKDAKIVEAGEKMNHYSIHTLVVVDSDKQPSAAKVVGIIDSFSCLPGTRFYH